MGGRILYLSCKRWLLSAYNTHWFSKCDHKGKGMSETLDYIVPCQGFCGITTVMSGHIPPGRHSSSPRSAALDSGSIRNGEEEGRREGGRHGGRKVLFLAWCFLHLPFVFMSPASAHFSLSFEMHFCVLLDIPNPVMWDMAGLSMT